MGVNLDRIGQIKVLLAALVDHSFHHLQIRTCTEGVNHLYFITVRLIRLIKRVKGRLLEIIPLVFFFKDIPDASGHDKTRHQFRIKAIFIDQLHNQSPLLGFKILAVGEDIMKQQLPLVLRLDNRIALGQFIACRPDDQRGDEAENSHDHDDTRPYSHCCSPSGKTIKHLSF